MQRLSFYCREDAAGVAWGLQISAPRRSRVSNFIARNKGKVKVKGPVIPAGDEKTLAELESLVKDFKARDRAVSELHAMFSGVGD